LSTWTTCQGRIAGLAHAQLDCGAVVGGEKRRHVTTAVRVPFPRAACNGDCAGEPVDETRAPRPVTERARRRLDAELAVSEWGASEGVEIVILARAGHLTARDRLPLAHINSRHACAAPGGRRLHQITFTRRSAAIVAASLPLRRRGPAPTRERRQRVKMAIGSTSSPTTRGPATAARFSRAEASRVVPGTFLSSWSGVSRRL